MATPSQLIEFYLYPTCSVNTAKHFASMYQPSFTPEGNDSMDEYPLEALLDGCIVRPDRFIAPGIEGGLLGEFFHPENHLETELPDRLPCDGMPIDELLDSSTSTENDWSRCKESEGKRNKHSVDEAGRRRNLSAEEVVRVAAALFIQTSALVSGDPAKLKLPFGASLASIRGEEHRSVELVSLLLAAAEKVSNEQYDPANVLLRRCGALSSKFGSAVDRVVYYFTDALQKRIDRETGRLSSSGRREVEPTTPQEVIDAVLTNHPVLLVCNIALPFPQVMQVTAIQALLENTASAKRIHVIDLSIKYGQQWIIFLQGLATRSPCPVESIKLTAVGASEELISATGKRLSSFAESLSLPFKFKTVLIPDFKELKETMFETEAGETVGIYTSLVVNNLIMKPESLNNLMRILQKLKPCLVTVMDVEGNQNSPSFINRFTEALFYHSAYFDCLGSLMKNSEENRLMIEGLLSQGIKCQIATEGDERVMRYVGVAVWRAFFRRFGLREADLSEWSMYQARLLIKQFIEDDSCTLVMNSKALLIGWKGTPLHFVSAWKFSQEEEISVSTSHVTEQDNGSEEQ